MDNKRSGLAMILVLVLIGLFVFGYFSNLSKQETGVSLWTKIGIPDTLGSPVQKDDNDKGDESEISVPSFLQNLVSPKDKDN